MRMCGHLFKLNRTLSCGKLLRKALLGGRVILKDRIEICNLKKILCGLLSIFDDKGIHGHG